MIVNLLSLDKHECTVTVEERKLLCRTGRTLLVNVAELKTSKVFHHLDRIREPAQ